jgi:hypothetical protein
MSITKRLTCHHPPHFTHKSAPKGTTNISFPAQLATPHTSPIKLLPQETPAALFPLSLTSAFAIYDEASHTEEGTYESGIKT